YGKKGLELTDPQSREFLSLKRCPQSIDFQYIGAEYDSTSSFFATLSYDYHLRYYAYDAASSIHSCESVGPIAEKTLCSDKSYYKGKILGKRVSFSPDGRCLLAALHNTCIISCVPIHILCSSFDRVSALLFRIFACNAAQEYFFSLPKDVRNLI